MVARSQASAALAQKGAIAGAISIPLRNMHQSTEMAHQEDVVATIELLTEGIKNLANYNWDFSANHDQGNIHPDAAKGSLDWL